MTLLRRHLALPQGSRFVVLVFGDSWAILEYWSYFVLLVLLFMVLFSRVSNVVVCGKSVCFSLFF